MSNTNIDTRSHIVTRNEKFKFSKISTEQVKPVTWKLVNNKATDFHDTPDRVLSQTETFNGSLLSKMFPDDLNTGKVAPVFKSGAV